MKRGTILWVNLSDAQPPEMGKVRPGLVLSNTTFNHRLPTVTVVPLSSQAGEIWPLRLKVGSMRKRPGYAVVPGLRQVSKTRLLARVGEATRGEMKRITEAMAEYLRE
jgi:mRNA-degrading endonuclease toxin of MazEF toxin-antitoxin module